MDIDGNITNRMIFLLGGHDLEMETIKDLLNKNHIPFHDHNLTWGNANLSEYEDVIRIVLKQSLDVMFYGIELRNDLHLSPSEAESFGKRYKAIDHHGLLTNQPSSLEQVAGLIKHQMTDDEKAVAINDVSHIRGLEEMGLPKSKIDEIRRKDRQAQGVTSEDEDLAEKDIKENLATDGELRIVTTSLKRFSPVSDRLYPYHSLLVISISEENPSFCYYGELASHMTDVADSDYWDVYFGGGGNGYCGGKLKSDIPYEKKKEQMVFLTSSGKGSLRFCVKAVLDSPVSQHVFILPIKYDTKAPIKPNAVWNRVPHPSQDNSRDQEELFDEKQYFFQYAHDALYDTGGKKTRVRHYERKVKDGKYTISVRIKENKTKDYDLSIKSINVNLYSTGIGTLSFYLDNMDHNQAAPEDILRINQYGRRVMLPFWGDKAGRTEIAEKLSITLPDENSSPVVYSEDYKQSKDTENWKLASFIDGLIKELNPTKPLSFEAVIDDRMFVLSWYKSSVRIKDYKKGDKDFWYRFLFVDGKDTTCQNDNMMRDLLDKHTYPRWEKYGTLYGISRYSMVMLTTDSAQWYAQHLFHSFTSIYTRMAELVLCQRASILLFDKRIKTRTSKQAVSNIYRDYLVFLNSYCLDEVTAQEQGIEIYDMLWDSSRIKSLSQELETQINAMNDLQSLSFDKNVSTIATVVLPITILATLVSLLQLGPEFDSSCVWRIISLVIAAGAVLSLILWVCIKRVNKKQY